MQEGPDFFDRLRERIASGDERGALSDLRQMTKGRVPRLHIESLQQLGALNHLAHSERLGEMTREEVRVASAQLRRALLQLVDAVEASLSKSQVPPAVANVDFGHPPDETGLEKIIGANNLKSIAWLRRGLDVARSVCRVVTPLTVGSGFIVRGGRLVTNHHVIPTADIAAKSYVEFNVEEDLTGQLAVPCRMTIDAESVNAKADLDYCLATLRPGADGAPVSTWGELEIEVDKIPAVGEHVTIIQHPAGGPKQIAITANQVVNIYEYRLQYSTDTMPGSSGSPVFNDAWKVVALHHKGGNIVANASGAKMFANEGILMCELRSRQLL